jgi:hypothetical protein
MWMQFRQKESEKGKSERQKEEITPFVEIKTAFG